jgi:hypothetical protein
MSRYVSVALAPSRREDLLAALAALGLEAELAAPGDAVMLEGSLECAGEPVEIRLPPGTLGAVEDFGFVRRDDAYVLVCGELDRTRLERDLVPKLRNQATVERLRAAAQAHGAQIEEHVEPDGTRRLLIKRDD